MESLVFPCGVSSIHRGRVASVGSGITDLDTCLLFNRFYFKNQANIIWLSNYNSRLIWWFKSLVQRFLPLWGASPMKNSLVIIIPHAVDNHSTDCSIFYIHEWICSNINDSCPILKLLNNKPVSIWFLYSVALFYFILLVPILCLNYRLQSSNQKACDQPTTTPTRRPRRRDRKRSRWRRLSSTWPRADGMLPKPQIAERKLPPPKKGRRTV